MKYANDEVKIESLQELYIFLNKQIPWMITDKGLMTVNFMLILAIINMLWINHEIYTIGCFLNVIFLTWKQSELKILDLLKKMTSFKNFIFLGVAIAFGPGTGFNDPITQTPICKYVSEYSELIFSGSYLAAYYITYVVLTIIGLVAYKKIFQTEKMSYGKEIWSSLLWATFMLIVMISLNNAYGMFSDEYFDVISREVYQILPNMWN